MNHFFRLLLIILLFSKISVAQKAELITVIFQMHDEPPTVQGRPTFKIEFKKESNGDFATDTYFRQESKISLNEIILEKERVQAFQEWQLLDKKMFNQAELDFDSKNIKNQPLSSYGLHFEFPSTLTVKVDSFNYCRSHRMTQTILLGGTKVKVMLRDGAGNITAIDFPSNSFKEDDFNLRDYILCYKMLGGRLPEEIPGTEFFSGKSFEQAMVYYQTVVECEDYYYKEFVEKHPERTNKENRTKAGWNFKEYLKQRKGK